MMAAHRYAQAILDLAYAQNAADEIYKNSSDLLALFNSNRELYNFLKSPLIKPDKKEKVFRQLFEKNISIILLQLMNILCKRRREAIFPEILSAIIHEYKKRQNIITAQLITAFHWDDELKKSMTEKLQQLTHSSKIDLQEIIDKTIIGGFILKTDDKQIDTSIKTQLQKLYQSFIQTNSLN